MVKAELITEKGEQFVHYKSYLIQRDKLLFSVAGGEK